MCSGTALLYKIPKIIIAENKNFQGHPDYLESRGVELTILDDPECTALMDKFIAEKPELWHEDIGED
jgi:cytosine deaminase